MILVLCKPMSSRESVNIPVHYSAETYDRFTKGFLGRFDRILADRLRQELRRKRTIRRVLDVGCGTAQFLIRLARDTAFEEISFLGLDLYKEMIEFSRKNVAEGQLDERIFIVRGDVHQMPFDTGAMELIISRSTLHHWTNPVAALVEIRRVLAVGGIALIHEIRRDADPSILALFNQFRREAGVEPSREEEKFTIKQIERIVTLAGVRSEATIFAPAKGYASLGCEIRIVASHRVF